MGPGVVVTATSRDANGGGLEITGGRGMGPGRRFRPALRPSLRPSGPQADQAIDEKLWGGVEGVPVYVLIGPDPGLVV